VGGAARISAFAMPGQRISPDFRSRHQRFLHILPLTLRLNPHLRLSLRFFSANSTHQRSCLCLDIYKDLLPLLLLHFPSSLLQPFPISNPTFDLRFPNLQLPTLITPASTALTSTSTHTHYTHPSHTYTHSQCLLPPTSTRSTSRPRASMLAASLRLLVVSLLRLSAALLCFAFLVLYRAMLPFSSLCVFFHVSPPSCFVVASQIACPFMIPKHRLLSSAPAFYLRH
jgi:hypothetical protein